MNFFFFLTKENFHCELNIPSFQNRGNFFDNQNVLYKCYINEKEWKYSEIKSSKEGFFWNLSSKNHSSDSVFFIHKKNSLNLLYSDKLKKYNNLTSTYPDFRANNKVYLNQGGFSSYQSDYPLKMIEKKGSILSPVNVLLNRYADKNFIFFRNIFHLPITDKFEVLLVNIKSFKILKVFECKTNQMNILNIDKEYISNENYIFSNNYLGIPVFCSEYDGYISLEHTHPPHEYILSNDKFKKVAEIKKQIYEKIFK